MSMKDWFLIAEQLEKTAKNSLLDDEVNSLMREAAARMRKDNEAFLAVVQEKTALKVEMIRMKAQLDQVEKEKEELEERIAIMTESEVEYVDPEWPPMEGNDDD